MQSSKHHGSEANGQAANGGVHEESSPDARGMAKVHVELTVAGVQTPVSLDVSNLSELRAAASEYFDNDDFELIERDADEPINDLGGRKALSVVAHRCKKVQVTVTFDREINDDFPPSATINKVLRWAVGKKGFKLDDDQQAKANLILPDAKDPLPREAMVGEFVTTGTCNLEFVLTLKDFTNGCR
jgi:hypothetical protein